MITAFPDLAQLKWSNYKEDGFNYGCIFAEYVFINQIKNSKNYCWEQNILELIKNESEPVIFVSVTLITLN